MVGNMLKSKIKNTEGFTIIELLMVLAVISLLVAIMIISLTTIRTKAGNSIIKNDIDQLRKYAEIMYVDSGMRGYCVSPGTVSCFESNNSRLNALKSDIQKRNKLNEEPFLFSNEDKFCIYANLSDNSYYCMDSMARQTTGDGAPLGSCNSSTFLCQ